MIAYAAASRERHHCVALGVRRRSAAEQVAGRAGRPTGTLPSTGSTRCAGATTSAASSATGAEPAGVRQRRAARRPARPRRRGRRRSRARSRRPPAARTPPRPRSAARDAAERCDLEDDDVRGLAQPVDVRGSAALRTPLVGGDPDVDPPAQLGLLVERGARLLGVLQAAPPSAAATARAAPRPRRRRPRPPLASTRTRAAGTARRASAAATAAHAREVVGQSTGPARRPSPWPYGSRRWRGPAAPPRRGRPPGRSR